MQSVGFKEWALVCAALGAGRQSVIIRKGGLAEGRDGYAFRHREFFLFPTFFHEQLARVRLSAAVLPEPRPNEIELCYFARIEEARIMTNWSEVRALEPLHILRQSGVRSRFAYDRPPGVHVAFVRTFDWNLSGVFPTRRRIVGVAVGWNCGPSADCGFIGRQE